MARLESSRDYIGAVDHPETGALIQLDESHSRDVCEAVAAEYHFLHVTGEGDSADADSGASGEDADAEAEAFRCGVEKSSGEPCERTVDSAGATCWQHQE